MFNNRKEFIEHYKSLIPPNTHWEQLGHCKATVAKAKYDPIKHSDVYVLKSYSTIVAFYFPIDNSLYILDWYSQTTQTHINKFCQLFYVKTTHYLYKNSRRILVKDVYYILRGEYNPDKFIQDGKMIWLT